MSNWREQLQPASFRGVPFQVMDESSPAGRRTQLHEYVQRDKPFVEDLGRVTRPFSFAAFVAGDDCLDQRDALLAAIDVSGAGELIHPWFGALQVTCSRCTVSHASRDGGMVRFELEFIESGEKGYPVATPHTAGQVEAAADDVMELGGNWFTDAMDQVNAARVQVNALTGSLAAAYGQLSTAVGTITSTVASAAALADMVLNAPANVLALVKGGVLSVRNSLQGIDPGAALRNLRSVAGGSSALDMVNPAGGADTVATVRAVNELVRSAQMAVALESAAQLPAERQAVVLPVVPTIWQQAAQPLDRPAALYLPDVLQGRDVLDKALQGAQQGGGGAPPIKVFTAYQDSRAAARRHMARAASAAVPLVVIKPPAVLPALVLAHRQWGDASRHQEIIERNRITHPGFVPPVDLRVARE